MINDLNNLSTEEPKTNHWYNVTVINKWFDHIVYKKSETKVDKFEKLFISTTYGILKIYDNYVRVVSCVLFHLDSWNINIEITTENQRMLINKLLIIDILNQPRIYYNSRSETRILNSSLCHFIKKILFPSYLLQYDNYMERLQILESRLGKTIGRIVFLYDDMCVLKPSEDDIRDIIDFIPCV